MNKLNLDKILKELRRERKLIDDAILSIERLLAASSRPRRGRPPGWLQRLKRRGRPLGQSKRAGTAAAA
jgi:hypothetical protein